MAVARQGTGDLGKAGPLNGAATSPLTWFSSPEFFNFLLAGIYANCCRHNESTTVSYINQDSSEHLQVAYNGWRWGQHQIVSWHCLLLCWTKNIQESVSQVMEIIETSRCRAKKMFDVAIQGSFLAAAWKR
ncbi:hypothetical protein ACQ4PT_029882 [Festuca glaucescens]